MVNGRHIGNCFLLQSEKVCYKVKESRKCPNNVYNVPSYLHFEGYVPSVSFQSKEGEIDVTIINNG